MTDGSIGVARGLGALAVMLGVIGLPIQRTRHRSTGGRRPDRTVAAVLSAATLMGLVTLIALFAPPMIVQDSSSPPRETQPQGTAASPEAPGETPPPTSAGGGNRGFELDDNPAAAIPSAPNRVAAGGPEAPADGFDWTTLQGWARMILWLLLLALAGLGVRAFRGRPERLQEEASPEPLIPAAQAEGLLEASLSDVTSTEGHPRQGITAAYRRLLAALTEAGAPRHHYEAPHEHLHRALGPLGVHADPMHQLTELYVLAQFSKREVTDKHRASAAAALQRCLENLRSQGAQVEKRPPTTTLADAPA